LRVWSYASYESAPGGSTEMASGRTPGSYCFIGAIDLAQKGMP
jgi:hypothetical protein